MVRSPRAGGDSQPPRTFTCRGAQAGVDKDEMADMKTGFSSLVCPGWNLETIFEQASKLGFDGVELRGLLGELHLPLIPELARHPKQVRSLAKDHNVDLICLGSSAYLTAQTAKERARQREIIGEFAELATKLECPFVRVFVGDVGRRDTHNAALSRAADMLLALTPTLARYGVTLLVENGGDFCGSQHLWFLIDAVSHPSVQCCWNQCSAMTVSERPTTSIPRLGSKIQLVHLCDADFDEFGVLNGYQSLGTGHVEVSRQIELLKGMMFGGYAVFDWPKLWVHSLPAPEQVLPGVADYLRKRIENRQAILTAYKNDKNAPRLRAVDAAQ